ncbi:hypothetical protein ACEPAH_7827 [Sanghuangporus vaninii]
MFGSQNQKRSKSRPFPSPLVPEKSVGETPGFIERVKRFWQRSNAGGNSIRIIERRHSTESIDNLVDSALDRIWAISHENLSLGELQDQAANGCEQLDRQKEETVDKARECILSKLPADLKILDVTKYLVDKQNIMVVNGGYCDVFVGRMTSEHLRCRIIHQKQSSTIVKIAIKRLRVRLNDDETELFESLTREMSIWAALDHPNILPFIGYVFEGVYPSLVSEWMMLGSLRDFLKKDHSGCNIVRLALGIAEGIKYLHDKDVVHSGIKPDNVLISESYQPLICDFGISRMINSSQTLLRLSKQDNPKGTIRWMAIELLKFTEGVSPQPHSKESDVWAYGMTLYEMISNQWPYAHLRQDFLVLSAVMSGHLPKLPILPATGTRLSSTVHSEICSICTRCWAEKPDERPTMTRIIQSLSSLSDDPPESTL